MAPPLRIVFLGSDPIALPLLEWLTSTGKQFGEIVAVFTQPDRPVGRGQKVVANAIKEWALASGLPLSQPEKLTSDVRQQFAQITPDLSLVMAYGHILRDDFIATPRLGTINLHASILPRYRGASPIQTAIANGESQTGVSLMRIVRALDAGPVADVECVPIESVDTASEIEEKLAGACVPLLERNLAQLASGELQFVDQDHNSATYCRRLTKDDGVLDFADTAARLAARINGLNPWPSCTLEVGGQPIKLGLAEALANAPSDFTVEPGVSPGRVLGSDARGLLVGTRGGVLRVLRLQRPGGKMLNAPEFLRGFPIEPDLNLPSRPMPLLVSPKPFPRG